MLAWERCMWYRERQAKAPEARLCRVKTAPRDLYCEHDERWETVTAIPLSGFPGDDPFPLQKTRWSVDQEYDKGRHGRAGKNNLC